MSAILNNYLIDTVKLIEDEGKPAIHIVSYRVVSTSAKEAYDKFIDNPDEEYPIVYKGLPVDSVIIGVGIEPPLLG